MPKLKKRGNATLRDGTVGPQIRGYDKKDARLIPRAEPKWLKQDTRPLENWDGKEMDNPHKKRRKVTKI